MKNKMCIAVTIVLSLMISNVSFSQGQESEKSPIKPALLIIDIQNAFLTMVPEREKEVALYSINMYIELFRRHGCPVIRVYHHGEEYGVVPGTDIFEFPASVSVQSDDPKIIKTYPDAFNKTNLDRMLKEHGSNTLFLSGLSAVGCVLATWIGANNHDYNAFLLKDAIMSHNEEFTNNVEVMFDAVGYDMVKLILENFGK